MCIKKGHYFFLSHENAWPILYCPDTATDGFNSANEVLAILKELMEVISCQENIILLGQTFFSKIARMFIVRWKTVAQ